MKKCMGKGDKELEEKPSKPTLSIREKQGLPKLTARRQIWGTGREAAIIPNAPPMGVHQGRAQHPGPVPLPQPGAGLPGQPRESGTSLGTGLSWAWPWACCWAQLGGAHGQAVGSWRPALLPCRWVRDRWTWGADVGSWAGQGGALAGGQSGTLGLLVASEPWCLDCPGCGQLKAAYKLLLQSQ